MFLIKIIKCDIFDRGVCHETIVFRDLYECIVNECVREGPANVLLLGLIDVYALDFPICPDGVSQQTEGKRSA